MASIAVRADQTALDEFEKKRFKDRHMDELLAQEIRSRLTAESKLAPQGPAMSVTVTNFHIRSTTAAVMLGMMAGTDFIEAVVEVTERGRVLKRYTGRATAVRGYGSEERIVRMAENLAEDLVEQL